MRIALTAVLLVTALHAAASGLSDITRSMRERAWEAEYIPESGDSIPPLTEHDEYEVVELFRAETPEELEAALADGYPPPWLAEILQDETIPEEDRYWLDCRVRAVIAQDLHLFFDREGNPVHYDADWIAPGEEYWRECFLVNPPGDVPRVEDGPSPTSNVDMDPGLVVDRFGDEIG